MDAPLALDPLTPVYRVVSLDSSDAISEVSACDVHLMLRPGSREDWVSGPQDRPVGLPVAVGFDEGASLFDGLLVDVDDSDAATSTPHECDDGTYTRQFARYKSTAGKLMDCWNILKRDPSGPPSCHSLLRLRTELASVTPATRDVQSGLRLVRLSLVSNGASGRRSGDTVWERCGTVELRLLSFSDEACARVNASCNGYLVLLYRGLQYVVFAGHASSAVVAEGLGRQLMLGDWFSACSRSAHSTCSGGWLRDLQGFYKAQPPVLQYFILELFVAAQFADGASEYDTVTATRARAALSES